MLHEVKAYLNISKTDTKEDTFLSDLIDWAKNQIENWCHQTLFNKTLTKKFYGYNGYILLPEYHNLEIISVKDIVDNPLTYTLDFVGCPKIVSNEILQDRYYVVNYSAGYTEIPFDLKQAIRELVTWKYQEHNQQRLGVDSVAISGAGESKTYKYIDVSNRVKKDLLEYIV